MSSLHSHQQTAHRLSFCTQKGESGMCMLSNSTVWHDEQLPLKMHGSCSTMRCALMPNVGSPVTAIHHLCRSETGHSHGRTRQILCWWQLEV